MTQRYWVIGGDFADQGFASLVPGTQKVSGPFADAARAKTEWTRLTFRDRCGAMTRYTIAVEDLRA